MSWKEFKLELIGMASAFQIQINEHTISWYSNALSKHDPQKLLMALREYGRTTKTQRLPTPYQIEEIMSPKLSAESEAREAASRVVKAVTDFGYINPEGARRYIGSLGWEAVRRFGGWGYLCENLGSELNVNTMFAQMRDICLAIFERHQKGYGNKPPEIANNEITELARGLVKKIE